jgi:hypothetical protein
MVVLFIENKFQLHTGAGGFVGIEIELGGNPSPESVNAALSKVCLKTRSLTWCRVIGDLACPQDWRVMQIAHLRPNSLRCSA